MRRWIFAASALVVVVGFLLAASWFKGQRAAELGFMAQTYAATFVRPHSAVLGAANAKVFIVEFTDPACETCAVFSPIAKRFLATYPEKIQLVVRYAPFHDGSSGAVRVLEAARGLDEDRQRDVERHRAGLRRRGVSELAQRAPEH